MARNWNPDSKSFLSLEKKEYQELGSQPTRVIKIA
jgi:hypothetical protein